MRGLLRGYFAIVAVAAFLAACQSVENGLGSISFRSLGRGMPVKIHYAGERPSRAWRKYGRIKRLIQFPTPIQHVFVISMENRSVENLFAGYYGQAWPGPGGGNWEDPNNFNLRNPNAMPTLLRNSLSKPFDPSHGHDQGWFYDSANDWSQSPIKCATTTCPPFATTYSYVPTSETAIYAGLVQKWAFANNVLQANEGPSFVAHQYFIAGQSGGIAGSRTAPDAEAENPGNLPLPGATGDYSRADDADVATSGCNPSGYRNKSVNMSLPVPSSTPLDNGGVISACEEYPVNILDEAASSFGQPSFADWQYIAHSDNTIWAAPLGVKHLWNAYSSDPNKGLEPFAVDPDAENFVLNVSGSTNPTPDPARPVAALTYITPCIHESDHPALHGKDDGPQWLAWVINAIGESQYWNSSVIFVTWDDWGGWYDNVPAMPFRPAQNGYGNADDPNEWGFRVPLIVISPYIKERGYVSSQATSGFQYRSQTVIMQYIEATLELASLGADDTQDNQSDGLSDIFDYAQTPLPYVPISTSFVPGAVGSCPSAGGDYRGIKRGRKPI